MLKEPRPGKTKTRLGKDIGFIKAAWWFRHQTNSLINRLALDQRWNTTLAVSPDQEGISSRIWPAFILRWAQGTGDLGQRMARIFRLAPRGPIIIIGADIPDITPTLIAKAFKALGAYDVVIGAAPDGGFWLIGMRRNRRALSQDLLQNIRWSSQHTLTDTIASLRDMSVTFIDTLNDIDTLTDLEEQKKAPQRAPFN